MMKKKLKEKQQEIEMDVEVRDEDGTNETKRTWKDKNLGLYNKMRRTRNYNYVSLR